MISHDQPLDADQAEALFLRDTLGGCVVQCGRCGSENNSFESPGAALTCGYCYSNLIYRPGCSW